MNRAARGSQRMLAGRYQQLQGWLLAALVCLYAARTLWPSESVARLGDGLPLSILAVVLALSWLSIGLLDRQLTVRWAPIDMAIGLLVVCNVLAALASAEHDAPRPALNMLWEWVSLGLLYFLARQLIDTAVERRAVVAVMIALAVGLAGYGLYQYFVSMPQTRVEFAADPDGLLRREGMWYPPGSVERELFEARLNSLEPLSTFALTNSLAGFLAAWFVCGFAIALHSGKQPRTLAAAAISLAVIGCCLLLTKSRSAYLATALGICGAALLLLPRAARIRGTYVAIGGAAAIGVLLVALLTGGLDRQVLSEAPKSLGYRWQYWQATTQMIADHPWLGVGPGNFGDHYTRYKLATASEEITDPHNFLLELAATAGLPALLAMLLVMLFALGELFSASDERQGATADLHGSADDEAKQRRQGATAGLSSSAARPILLGGAAAFGVAFALPWLTGALIEAPPDLFTLLLILVPSACIAWVWFPWITNGWLSRRATLLAGLALLVNLLAAGGIAFPAVAGSFWLLLALSLDPARARRVELRQASVFALWIACLGLLVACYSTGYRPVLSSQSEMTLSRLVPQRAAEHLQAAAEADRWASLPHMALAEYFFQRWQQDHGDEHFAQFERAIDDATRLRPHQSSLWQRRGDGYLAGFRESPQPRLIEAAVAAYERAVELYPHHARPRAKLAVALAAAGQLPEAREQAQHALDLDASMPHADQKLRPEQLQQLAEAGLLDAR